MFLWGFEERPKLVGEQWGLLRGGASPVINKTPPADASPPATPPVGVSGPVLTDDMSKQGYSLMKASDAIAEMGGSDRAREMMLEGTPPDYNDVAFYNEKKGVLYLKIKKGSEIYYLRKQLPPDRKDQQPSNFSGVKSGWYNQGDVTEAKATRDKVLESWNALPQQGNSAPPPVPIKNASKDTGGYPIWALNDLNGGQMRRVLDDGSKDVRYNEKDKSYYGWSDEHGGWFKLKYGGTNDNDAKLQYEKELAVVEPNQSPKSPAKPPAQQPAPPAPKQPQPPETPTLQVAGDVLVQPPAQPASPPAQPAALQKKSFEMITSDQAKGFVEPVKGNGEIRYSNEFYYGKAGDKWFKIKDLNVKITSKKTGKLSPPDEKKLLEAYAAQKDQAVAQEKVAATPPPTPQPPTPAPAPQPASPAPPSPPSPGEGISLDQILKTNGRHYTTIDDGVIKTSNGKYFYELGDGTYTQYTADEVKTLKAELKEREEKSKAESAKNEEKRAKEAEARAAKKAEESQKQQALMTQAFGNINAGLANGFQAHSQLGINGVGNFASSVRTGMPGLGIQGYGGMPGTGAGGPGFAPPSAAMSATGMGGGSGVMNGSVSGVEELITMMGEAKRKGKELIDKVMNMIKAAMSGNGPIDILDVIDCFHKGSLVAETRSGLVGMIVAVQLLVIDDKTSKSTELMSSVSSNDPKFQQKMMEFQSRSQQDGSMRSMLMNMLKDVQAFREEVANTDKEVASTQHRINLTVARAG